MQLRKHNAMYLPTCNLPWNMVLDRTYVHGMKSPRRQQKHQEKETWQDQSWQWNQGGGQRGKSPRQKNRARSAKGQRQPHPAQAPQMPMLPGPPMSGASMAPLAPMMNWGMQQSMPSVPMAQQQYQTMPYPPPLPPPDSPWQGPANCNATGPLQGPGQTVTVMGPQFAMPAMPKMPSMPQVSTDNIDTDLMTMLRQDVAELPPHIQKAVKETALKEGVKEGARATRDLHTAAKNLGHTRKAYENAILARSQLHSNWRQFLSDAVRLWQDYAVQFTAQEKKLQEQVAITKEAFLQAKEISAKAHDAAGEVQEISDEDPGEGTSVPSAAAVKITETMEGLSHSLLNLQEQAAAIDAEEKAHQAKRPRTHPKPEDANMPDAGGGHGATGPSFGKAG